MRFETINETKVVGLGARFISILSPTSDGGGSLSQLWRTFYDRADEISERASAAALGVTLALPSDTSAHPDERLYIAGCEVSSYAEMPEGMTNLTIPAGEYAVFTHEGPPETMITTLNYIHREWLPQSGRELREAAPHLELYGERFRPGESDSAFEIMIPV